jgi:hypothetical protein
MLSHLPLPAHEPGRVGDFSQETTLQVGLVAGPRLQPMMNV